MRALALSVAFATVVAGDQRPSTVNDLRYEAVSIKRNRSNALGSNGSSERPDGGFTLLNAPIMTLIGRVQFPAIVPVDMVGLPEWAQREAYDVSATSPLSRPATPQERAAMIRAMLADRVRLVTHVEKRQSPVYDLVLARSDGRLGTGIKPSEVDCVARAAADKGAAEAGVAPSRPTVGDFKAPPAPCSGVRVDCVARAAADKAAAEAGAPPSRPAVGDFKAPPAPCSGVRVDGGFEGDVTMETLAFLLRPTAGRPVVDKTGLKGSYRIKVQFDRAFVGGGPTVEPSPNAPPSVFVALPAQLGLKLESSKGERDVLVIDRLERPTEN